MPIYGITPKLPLASDPVDGKYTLIKQYKEAVKQNFKNLILTSPGERMMDINFGVGIKRFLFEMREDAKSSLRAKIYTQAKKYLPYIEVKAIEYRDETDVLYAEEVLTVRIVYEIIPLGSVDIMELNIKK